jgi:hypothetical protein
MRVTSGFDERSNRLYDEWWSICTSPDEPTSSLQEFEGEVVSARNLLATTPPGFRRAASHVEKAIEITKSEPFKILDKRSRDRLAGCPVRVRRLQAQINGLRDEIMERQKADGFTVRLCGKRYEIEAEEVRDRAMNVAHSIASAKVCSGPGESALLAMLEKVAARAQQTRPRYFAVKVALLTAYLETDAHADVMPKAVQDVVAELRFQGMDKHDIRHLVSFFGRGTPRCQIDRFARSLLFEREYTVYTIAPALKMDSTQTTLLGLELHGSAQAIEKRISTEGLPPRLFERFMAYAEHSVIAKSTAEASNPSLAVMQARSSVDAVANLVAYLNRLSGPSSDIAHGPSLVCDGRRLVQSAGTASVHDRPLRLDSVLNRRVRRLLKVTGAGLPESSRTELQERVLTSMHWYRLGVVSQTLEERYVDHSIALETLLSARQTERDKKRILADRATKLRHILKAGRGYHEKLIERLYASRSDLVHAGLYRSRTLLQDSRDLESAVLGCIFVALDGIGNGCSDLEELLARIERQRSRLRKKRIRNSRLQANRSVPFSGSLLNPSDAEIAEVTGELTLVDEGEDGYAYHDLAVRNAIYRKPFAIKSSDQYWFQGAAAGCRVALRDGRIADGGSLSMFFAISGEARSFTYRAFDNVVFND